jgi:hypothetical protein
MSVSADNETHDSSGAPALPTVAEVDGWVAESSSHDQPTKEQLEERIRGEAPSAGDEPKPVVEPKAEDDDLDDDDKAPEAKGDEAKPKKRETAAERKAVLRAEINALVREREETRRALEAERAPKKPVPEPVPAAAAPVKDEKAPEAAAAVDSEEPDWDAYEASGKTFKEYQHDHAAWLRKVIAAEADARASRTASEVVSTARERELAIAEVAREDARREAAMAKYPDWEATIKENLEDVPLTPFVETVVRRHPAGMELLYTLAQHPVESKILATLQMTRPIMDAVKEATDPAPLLLYFAHHPKEHARIAHLDPPRQLMALGRLSATLSQPDAKNGSSGVTPPVTQAKPPIRPVGGTRAAGSGTRDPDELDFGPEYVAAENAARASRQRR